MPITQYPEYMNEPLGIGRIGLYPEHRADTLAAAETIPWGAAVQYGANAEQGEVYDGARPFRGVAIAGHHAEYRVADVNNDIVGQHVQYDAISVLRKGAIWVKVLEDVIKGDAAKADKTTGNFRPGGTATTTVSGVIGEFKTAALANGLALLEINLPIGGA